MAGVFWFNFPQRTMSAAHAMPPARIRRRYTRVAESTHSAKPAPAVLPERTGRGYSFDDIR